MFTLGKTCINMQTNALFLNNSQYFEIYQQVAGFYTHPELTDTYLRLVIVY